MNVTENQGNRSTPPKKSHALSAIPLALKKFFSSLKTAIKPDAKVVAHKEFLAKQDRIITKLYGNQAIEVRAGFFAGLRYVNLKLKKSVPSALLPKLIGSYEDELTPVWNEVLKTDYDIIIDIGCAEGIYAIGFALKYPRAIVYAFDINENARQLCAEMARINGVEDRVVVGTEYHATSLQQLRTKASHRILIISDCEGAEFDLIDPVKEPLLLQCDLVVECHDFIKRGISDVILRRFEKSHHVKITQSNNSKDVSRYPLIKELEEQEKRLAVSEFRPEVMNWIHLLRK